MDHSAPMLASFEVLPDMLTAKDLEAVLQAPDRALALEERSSQPRSVHGKGAKRQ